ncbi:CoA-disulfide reductase [Lentilactobacillus parafarraginis]|jgi:NADPH-dependent 2,4-dienoyl-CoA reductase/sulfur reductase-like enzyme/rhodanese-related sulfurtransferase|uniref:CoA-disulfide reductase n=1 Tax=Lentilactobacillus parafarraginis TaxID=390842 RepID=A0A5R9CY16_9LACO|nr:FAD-dependent oxidoreductase [Lentilactobacillus parafarraginis]TLQ20768.1 CoA-disulfide reductase [Lentilactobacillus parafarraginis]
MRIVIVGGVAGGMSAATRLRRLSEDTEIIVLDKGPYVSFANCALPYYLSGTIKDRDQLVVESPEHLKQRFRIDVRPNTQVTAIDPDKHQLTAVAGGEEATIDYDRLILAPGSTATIPDIKGLETADNVFTLRNIPDVDRIMASLNHDAKTTAVVGAGSVGIEAVENLTKRGIETTLIEAGDHILPFMDEEMAALVSRETTQHGVTLKLNTRVDEIANHQLKLSDGTTVDADLVILAVGVHPNTDTAQQAGIKTGQRGGIVVDDQYRTSAPDIYAVGDAILVKQLITGKLTSIPLASPANRQGRQVADVIMGLNRRNRGGIGTAIVRSFDMAAASTGLNRRQLDEAGIAYQTIHITGQSHAAYYPGGTPLSLKVMFDAKTGQLYGAQAVGKASADKRIDVLSVAIKAKMSISDLPELELSYAPPFGSAKDPVNMAGYAGENLLEGLSDNIQFDQVDDAVRNGAYLIDVRSPKELQRDGRLPDAVNIPLDSLRDHLDELPKNRPLIVSCRSGQRSYIAERILKNDGFDVKNLDGAFLTYSAAYPERIQH